MSFEEIVRDYKDNGRTLSRATRDGVEVTLRPAEERDCDDTYSWREANPHNFLTVSMPTREQWRDYHNNVYLPKNNDITFILESDKAPFGMVALTGIEESDAELVRTLRGIEGVVTGGMTTGAVEMLRFAFEDLKLPQVHLEVFSDNQRAISLYLDCGFVKSGDEYAMAKDEKGNWDRHENPKVEGAERYMTPMVLTKERFYSLHKDS